MNISRIMSKKKSNKLENLIVYTDGSCLMNGKVGAIWWNRYSFS